jgi:hypothetical protein
VAFRGVAGPHLRALHVHTYPMLGFLDDADQALQDALLRARLALDTYRARCHRATPIFPADIVRNDRHDLRPLSLPIDRRWRAELEHLPIILAITRARTLWQIFGDPAPPGLTNKSRFATGAGSTA